MLKLVLTLSPTTTYLTIGLAGTYNGNQDDDFTYDNGTILPEDATTSQIHNWGMSCKYAVSTQQIKGQMKFQELINWLLWHVEPLFQISHHFISRGVVLYNLAFDAHHLF